MKGEDLRTKTMKGCSIVPRQVRGLALVSQKPISLASWLFSLERCDHACMFCRSSEIVSVHRLETVFSRFIPYSRQSIIEG